jgi:hypothetical protein
VDVSDDASGADSGHGPRQRLRPVTNDKHNIAIQLGDGFRNADHAAAHGEALACGIVVAFLHRHGSVDAPPVLPDRIDGVPESLDQVHARDEQLKLQSGMTPYGLQDGPEDAIFGSRSRNDEDTAAGTALH